MNEYIKNLLTSMSDTNYVAGEVEIKGQYESNKTISWKAHEEARGLSDAALIDGLFIDIAAEHNRDTKRDLYFILKQIAINTKNKGATVFLLERLPLEKDRFVLVTMLSGLADLYKPADLDLTNILKCAESKNWQVRGKAYEALANSSYNVEEFLLKRLELAQNNDDIRYLLTALKYVATKTSVPAIEDFLKHRQPAIGNAAAYTLAIIMLREGHSIDDIHQKTSISVEGLNELAKKLPLITRPPL